LSEICYICQEITSTPHHHHVHQQAYGGRDGDVVVLCPTHHNLIHRLAKSTNSDFNFKSPLERRRAEPLIACLRASETVGTKLFKYTLEFDTTNRGRLEKLKLEIGETSLLRTIYFCIEAVMKHYKI
jgi:hypothetical protein